MRESLKTASEEVTDELLDQWGSLWDINRFFLPVAIRTINLKQQIESCKHSQIHEVLEQKDEYGTLGMIIHYRGRDKATQVVMSIITDGLVQLSVSRGFNEAMLRTCAEWILQDNRNLLISDLKLIMKMGIRGDFGPIFDRLDTNVVLNWVNEYWNRRLEISSERSRMKHESIKEKR